MAKRAAVAVAVAATLCGCVTEQNRAQATALMSVWGDCVMAAVARMDDGKTDPMSMAYGIAPSCGSQYVQFTEVEVSNYTTENAQRAQRQLWRDKEMQMITSAILIKRAKDKKT